MAPFRFSPRPNRAAEAGWLPWSPGAFERAQREHKPILLSISAVWCHWCHVMDETTYSDDAVLAAIRERFVPVRVDNDERPDINARYNMGGWPTTAFLSSDGTTLTGATYVPPDQMVAILEQVAAWYASHRDDVAAHTEAVRASGVRHGPPESDGLRAGDADRAVEAIAAAFDETYAGFGDAPKFPQPELLETLLVETETSGNERFRTMAIRTLLAMARGGMYDHVEGGFFRYSTTRDWSVPHFEKMTEDHAGLVRVLAHLLQRSSHEELRATLRSAVAYVASVLRDPNTGFFAGSQDADEEYYALPLDERRTREAPYVDRTIYADRNAALAGALCLAGAALEDDGIVALGIRALDELDASFRDGDGLLFHVRRPGEAPTIRGLLGDQSAYLRSLLDAHETTGDARFLERAVVAAQATIHHFGGDDGGFYDHAGVEEPLGRLALRDRPLVENALLAESLMRLGDLCAEERYRELAERALLVHASSFANAGPFAATQVRAMRRFFAAPVCVRVVADGFGDAFREAARRLPSPFVSVRTLAPADAAALDIPAEPAPAAYICTGRTCGAPVRSAAMLRESYDAVAP